MPALKITLSGPAASGKSIVGRALAKLLKDAGHSVLLTDDDGKVSVDIDALPDLDTHITALNPQHHVPYQVSIGTVET